MCKIFPFDSPIFPSFERLGEDGECRFEHTHTHTDHTDGIIDTVSGSIYQLLHVRLVCKLMLDSITTSATLKFPSARHLNGVDSRHVPIFVYRDSIEIKLWIFGGFSLFLSLFFFFFSFSVHFPISICPKKRCVSYFSRLDASMFA